MTTVPQSYVSLLQEMASGTGLPYAVEAAQANDESGFQSNAVSSAGAEGWLQFLPSTYDAYAAQAGVPPGTEFNPADEAKVYVVYMDALLKQEGGSVFKALEAYNAGPNNLGAGAGYASSILSAAGQGTNISASGGSGSTVVQQATTLSDPFPGGNFDPLNWGFNLGQAAENAIVGQLASAGKKIEADLWSKAKPLLIRFGLIVFGALIVFAGINGLLKGDSAGPTQIVVNGVKGAAKKRGTLWITCMPPVPANPEKPT
jgi:hypothetical protein